MPWNIARNTKKGRLTGRKDKKTKRRAKRRSRRNISMKQLTF